jgi:hypothetical protein
MSVRNRDRIVWSIRITGFFIIALQLVQFRTVEVWQIENEAWQDSISTVIAERDHLDSLYRDHLDNCSFIEKDDINLDSQGYLYSHYHKYEGTRH